MQSWFIKNILPILGFLAVLNGCGTMASRETGSRAHLYGKPGASTMGVINGVKIGLYNSALPAWVQLPQELASLEISLINRSASPIRIRYGNFLITTSHGDTFQIIPPKPVENFAVEPRFEHERFMVASHQQSVWQDLPVYPEIFPYDSSDYSAKSIIRDRAGWNGREMLGDMLPEGVLQPGGTLSGIVLIENFPVRNAHPTMIIRLMNARGNQLFGETELAVPVEK